MTADTFRKIALSLPDTVEAGHMGHPDFRRTGKIFATLGSAGSEWGMVKLAPEEQTVLLAAQPKVFTPANGAWGRNGSTMVLLAAAHESDIVTAMQMAWANAAPKVRATPRGRRAR